MEGYAAWQQNVEYTAREDRSVLAALLSEGVLDPDDGGLLVTERAAGASMSVDVAAGTCVVEGTEQADQYTYLCVFEDGDNLPVDSADPSDPRVDRVVVRVYDSAVSGTVDKAEVEVLTGTPDASPEPPSVPDSAVTLALVTVNAGTASITDADVSDERPTGSAGGLSEATANATYERLDTPATVTSSSTPTIDFTSTTRMYVLTQSGSVDPSWAGVPSSGETARSVTIVITDSEDPSWPSGTRYPGGEPPDHTPEQWYVAVARGGAVTLHPSSAEVS